MACGSTASAAARLGAGSEDGQRAAAGRIPVRRVLEDVARGRSPALR
ncbi:hypothetical protein [Streptomyces sp. 7-21]|nr:hypothetical protein [Streptomyces sp. 7-21]MBL1067189.1 hypothetical protein [Streptomyces sp. 7-21]